MNTTDEDSIEAVAARLQRARKVFGLGKQEFADGAGISPQAYGAFENGRRELSLIAAKKLRKAYKLSLEFLYFGNTDDLPTRISRQLGHAEEE